jgi:hypothetical protein
MALVGTLHSNNHHCLTTIGFLTAAGQTQRFNDPATVLMFPPA